MKQCSVCIHALFITLTLTGTVSLLVIPAEKLAEVVGDVKSARSQHATNEVCDESDQIENWNIYCAGEILSAMNLHRVELDSKTFVDRPLKKDPKVVLEAFEKEFGRIPIEKISVKKLIAFRNRYFGEAGTELKNCTISQWEELPPKIARIKDESLRNFAKFLNGRWKDLCRSIDTKDEKWNSLIEVPNPFIVPGGRFREFYYWDAYWIVKGLIVSNLLEMVKNMLLNFIYCVKKFGFVPNGGRTYYLRRSQPPFLIPMVYEYYETTKDIKFVQDNLAHLIREFDFWLLNRSEKFTDAEGNKFKVFRYRTISNVPRPESFRVDIEAATEVDREQRAKFFQDIASAAESGWDFSSRWFSDRRSMKTIETTNVIPVDLQALLCWNARILKYFAEITGDDNKRAKFEETEKEIRRTINVLLYNKTEKAWLDYNTRVNSHNTLYYPATAMILFTGCYADLDIEISSKVIEFMNAFKLARKWVLANYKVFQKTNKMWEKIDVTGTVPKPGKGGEYNVQDGFGWTNGVILDLLSTYYDSMAVEETDDKFPSQVTTSKIESPKNKSSKITPSRIKDSKKITFETKAPQIICPSEAYRMNCRIVIFITLLITFSQYSTY